MIETLSNTLENIGFLPVLALIYLFSLLIFWFESKQVKKDSNSIFDQWFITTTGMILWGRISYIIASWEGFSNWYWFWLPYEKYGDQIFLFRAMPWRLFAIWDGGFLFIAMFLSFILFNFLYVLFVKKWRWREMMIVIVVTANFMLSTFLFAYGLFTKTNEATRNGLIILLYTVAFQIMISLLKFVYRRKKDAFIRIGQILILLFTIGDIILISYVFLSVNISNIEKWHVYGFVLLGIIMVISYIIDVKRDQNKRPGDQKHSRPDITLNQAIKASNG
jgi:hypothetical protein